MAVLHMETLGKLLGLIQTHAARPTLCTFAVRRDLIEASRFYEVLMSLAYLHVETLKKLLNLIEAHAARPTLCTNVVIFILSRRRDSLRF